MLIDTKNILGVGTGRIVVDNLDGTVTKVPYGALGVKQNQREFKLSKYKDYVAVTELSGDYIIQEKLTDIIIVPYKYKSTKRILKYLKKQVPDYDFSLIIKHRLHNRVQIGKDNKGVYKYFDYEDVKYYENNKAIDFSEVDDMKYPTTKAIKDLIDTGGNGSIWRYE